MKFKYLIIAFVIIVALLLIYVFLIKKTVMPTNLKSMHIGYTKGWSINSNVSYDLNCIDNCIVKIKPYGEEEEKTIVVSSDVKDKIETVLLKYHVEKWDDFHKVDKYVLDGDSFSFNAKFENMEISASGYMKWPNNYREVIEELDAIFMDLYKN